MHIIFNALRVIGYNIFAKHSMYIFHVNSIYFYASHFKFRYTGYFVSLSENKAHVKQN